jgi:hypothetical protein
MVSSKMNFPQRIQKRAFKDPLSNARRKLCASLVHYFLLSNNLKSKKIYLHIMQSSFIKIIGLKFSIYYIFLTDF